MRIERFNNGALILGDCLEVLQKLPECSIDLVVTDCPYKITAGGITTKQLGGILKPTSDGTNASNKWLKKDGSVPCAVKNGKMFANNDIDFEDWLPEVYRVLKPGTHCYVMINSRNLKDLQVAAERSKFVFQNLLVWRKNNATPNKYFMQNGEFVLMLSKRPARSINSLGSKTVFSIPNIIGGKRHPSEKPVDLLRHFIVNSSERGQSVLDPFVGCGSTSEAAALEGRQFIGIELDEKYFAVACDRLKNVK